MDTILAILLLHATAQIQILKEMLKNLGSTAVGNDAYENLKSCVEHYTAIVKWVIKSTENTD